MKNKYLKYIICFFSILSIVASPALIVSAGQINSDNTMILSCGRPSSGSSTGFLEVCLRRPDSDELTCRVFSWNIFQEFTHWFPEEQTFTTDMSIRIEFYHNDSTGEDVVNFNFVSIEGLANEYIANIFSVNEGGNRMFGKVNTNGLYYDYSTSLEIVGYHVYGNAIVYGSENVGTEKFFIAYAESGVIYNAITQSQSDYTDKIIANQNENTDKIADNQDKNSQNLVLKIVELILSQNDNTDKITKNQDDNADKIINAGEDVDQPDFDSTNNDLDNTTNQMNKIESEYTLDKTDTQKSLNAGKNFILGTDMHNASIQVKNWIEKFGSDNVVISGFLVACMVLGVCFWIIGRKSW